MTAIPEPNQIWQHFKGQRYKVLAIALHSETQEKLVVYQAWDEPSKLQVWARPLGMWMEPPTVKPTEPAEYNCYHSMQSHFIDKDDKMWCQDCIDSAEVGRFYYVEPEP
jgi:hypothetical protein